MNILTIGGSDSSSGAGIQSDIRTFSDFGVYGFTVITAITSQNTTDVSNIEPVSVKSLKSQLDSILSDFHIDAIKIGMVYNSVIIKVIHSKLCNCHVPIIVDPIIKSTTGVTLLKKNALNNYKKMIIPLAHVITPNKYEAKILSGVTNMREAAKKIQKFGAESVIITGTSTSKGKISDFILEKDLEYKVTGKIIPIRNHGSGCNYSASIAVSLAKQNPLRYAVTTAKNYGFCLYSKERSDDDQIWLVYPTHLLKEFIKDYPIKPGGDNNTSRGHIVPAKDLIDIQIQQLKFHVQ